jgi:hypothetical protein
MFNSQVFQGTIAPRDPYGIRTIGPGDLMMTVWQTCTCAALAGLSLLAHSPQGMGQTVTAPQAHEVAGAHEAAVVGAAWNADSTGIPGARLRLRNVASGKIVAATRANDAGQFRFAAVPEGSYVIELVDESGKVLALGHVFAVSPGETVATFVRVGTHVPWFTGFFSNAAAVAITTAASEGVTALAPVARPASRKQ